jgi:hypothetical protein
MKQPFAHPVGVHVLNHRLPPLQALRFTEYWRMHVYLMAESSLMGKM